MTIREPIAELVDSSDPTPAPELETKTDPEPSPETPAKEDAPVEPQKTEDDPATPTEPLFDLPDGRKVTAAELKTEYDNLLPEFTRRSQRLAEYEKGGDRKPSEDIKSNLDNKPKWQDPDYVPQSYAEIVEIATAEAERRIQERAQAETERIKAIESEVDTQLNELKKTDPKLDENALFTHANKYGFTDLRVAYSNMKDMKQAIVSTEQKVVKNLQKREADPVSSAAGGSTDGDEGYDPREMSQFHSAVEFLARVKGK